MKMFHAIAALVSAALLAPAAMAGAPPASKLDTTKVGDGLYVIHNVAVPGNVTVMVTNDGVLLVDDKFDSDLDNILAEVRKLTMQPVKYVINTHYHLDHSGSNVRLQAMGVQVVSSANARAKMVESKQPGWANFTVENRGTVHLGGKRAEIYYFGRSHTDGDVVVYFPDHKVMAMGDMFTVGDATPQLVDYAGGGSARAWPNTIDGALMLDVDTVVPGHGPNTTKAELRKFRESTVLIQTRVRQLLAEKKGRADIEAVLRKDFHWGDLNVSRGLDGLIAEMQ
jgi:glyoxylase-like metal-dependent hydrolase (beta-lactamase superfamily II)